ncbi:RHS repeat domain-containing protein [Hyalangium gracile]|uniref:hypothetical protein n=1 Tax=Hyalangium gracile TaxID=394092 RepID=UPI001CC8FCB0|nr:hypothetical protein [Hyalangium gracile]
MSAVRLRQNNLLMVLVVLGASGIACKAKESPPGEASKPQLSEGGTAEVPFDVNAIIRQAHFSYRPEQGGWEGGHSSYEVRATPRGHTLTPVHTRWSSELEEPEQPGASLAARPPPTVEVKTGTPIVLRTARVSRGQQRLSVEAPRGLVEKDGHLAFAHGSVVEHLRNNEQGVEQSWSFEAPPAGEGELRVDIPVEGLAYKGSSERGLHFADARTGSGVWYGHGTWVDAEGRRTPVRAEYANGQIQLRVPSEVLAASAYPAVLDPLVSTEMIIDGRLAYEDNFHRTHPSLAFNGTNYLLVWRDSRGALVRLYGTRVSSTGAVLDPSGFVVSNGPGNKTNPVVASNGTDFYVAWEQSFYNWTVRGTRVTASGAVSNPGGVPLGAPSGQDIWTDVASNGTDYLVVWARGSNLQVEGDVFARRVSSMGVPLGSGEISIATDPAYIETAPSVASNGTDYLVAWQDERSGSSRVYATRVSSAGAVLDGTGFALSSSFSQNQAQHHATVASNGTDFLVTWLDFRSGVSLDVYGARVTSSGTVVDATGLAITATSTQEERDPVASSNGSDYFVAWSSWDTSVSRFQIKGSRISASASGSSAVLDVPALELSSLGGAFRYADLAPAGSGYLAVWEGYGDTTREKELYGVWVTSSGGISDAGNFPVLEYFWPPLYQVEPDIASNGNNYLVVWTDIAGASSAIYGARVTREGGAIDVPPLVIGLADRERGTPAVASNGTDYFVTWRDFRNINWDIYGARVLGSGASSSAVVDPSGISISTDPAFQNAPDIASNGTDYFVVWRKDVGGPANVHGARVTSAGAVLDTSGIAIATSSADHYTPRVASNGSNYLVVWAESQGTTSWDVLGRRVSTAGAVLDTSAIAISTAVREQYEPDVASNGTDYFVAWADYRSGSNHDIYGARVSGGGALLDAAGLALCTDPVQQYVPKVAYDGTNYVAAWPDYRWDSFWDVFATQVTSTGTVVTPNGFSVSYNVRETEPHVALASGGGQQSFLVFSRHDAEPSTTTDNRRIRGQFISF